MHRATFTHRPTLGFIIVVSVIAFVQKPLHAQLPTGWKQHDWDRARPPIVTPGPSNLPLLPPADAKVLFDGTDLSQWRADNGEAAKWIIKDGVLESVPGSGYLISAAKFGDVQLHVEWSAPTPAKGKSQGRGNSGVFLQRLYEVQVLDSFENITYADGQAGAIYGQYPPIVNASREPGQWQSFDIVFRAPVIVDGKVSKPARMTVFHNGLLVQDNVELIGPTSWLQYGKYPTDSEPRPLAIQDHGNPVRYRNIWLRELPPTRLEPPTQPYDPVVIELTESQLDAYVGKYKRADGGSWEVTKKEGKLYFSVFGTPLEMIPHPLDEFGLRYTAGTLTFKRNEAGIANRVEFSMGGDTNAALR